MILNGYFDIIEDVVLALLHLKSLQNSGKHLHLLPKLINV